MPVVSRRHNLVPRVLCIDGLSGSGKTALITILSTFDRIEMVKIQYIYDYVCALNYLKRIEKDAAEILIKNCMDTMTYNNMISREVNFRPSDISSVLKSSKRATYLERLFVSGGSDIIEQIATEKPIFHIMTHQAIGISEPLFNALKSKMLFIEMLRHPLFLVPAWYSYFDRYGNDPLELTIYFDYNGKDLPWFVFGWEDQYLESNKMDRIIYCIKHLTNLRNEFLEKKGTDFQKQILLIPFEKFVTSPWPYLDNIKELLECNYTDKTLEIMKSQNIPRYIVGDIPNNEVFKKYGYQPLGNIGEKDDIIQKWSFVEEEASAKAFEVFKSVCEDYEKRYELAF